MKRSLKASQYNAVINYKDGHLAFNARNCALVKVNDTFLSLLKNPNDSELIANNKSLMEAMVKAGFLIDSDTDELKLLEAMFLKDKFSRETLEIIILPTLDCNFHCFYCFENKYHIYMTSEVVEKTIQFIKNHLPDYHRLHITWFGGEPMLAANLIWEISDNVLKIVESMHRQYDSSIITNGYLIKKEHLPLFKKYKINAFQITLDGPKDIHNKRRVERMGSDSFTQIYENIKLLSEDGFRIACRVNLDKTDLADIPLLLHQIGKDKLDNVVVSFGRVVALNRTYNKLDEMCLTENEFAAVVRHFTRLMDEMGLKVIDKYPYYPYPMRRGCGASSANTFVIHPDGGIYRCLDNFDKKIGSVQDGININEKEKNNEASWLTWSPFTDPECVKCIALPICMGGCPYLGMLENKKRCSIWKENIEETITNKYERSLKH